MFIPTISLDTDVVLEDERVRLRPLEESDIQYFIPYVLNEPDIWQYSLVRPSDEESMTAYVHNAVTARTEGREYPFIVFDKQTGTYVGSTRFYDIQPQHRSLQLGYTWYAKAQQGTGLNKHCKYLLLSFAFEQWGIERVELRADTRNARSIAAMQRIGCTIEGTLRSHCLTADGSRRDSIVLSILKEEWLNGKKEQLQQQLNP
ncbi:putative ribosomal N-acetyltransferase YdaF [compost metagenome]